METMQSFWQLGDELRGQSKVSEDHKWLVAASKLAEQTRLKGERMNNLDLSKGPAEIRTREKFGFQEDNKFESLNFNMLNLDSKLTENVSKSSFRNGIYNMNAVYQKNNASLVGNLMVDKRFKTLPATETLPRNEVLGGYIFVCNNDTMQEDLKRQLFGNLLFLIFSWTQVKVPSFGGSNIDPTAWEDKKCKGESRFPAQVRIRVRKLCKALEEDAFRPVLHHYDGPKFRLELSVPEPETDGQILTVILQTLDLLDLCEQAGSVA
ncbi:hypothetical protein FH972_007229 [Carpinus fangiana]|uniref:DCD domain-containing protein n=1 Tax=Carpinus fangiana TaxID=176857 RepID=A0A5N6QVR3_9ROSI|nr:hypothetical protein FH972_007229 [Carpinus fangiana]